MSDRDLLEAAARAAGIEADYFECEGDEPSGMWGSGYAGWNPLTNDGDALRLAVMLGIQVTQNCPINKRARPSVTAFYDTPFTEAYGLDPYAATRRAIVRAAAVLTQPEGGAS